MFIEVPHARLERRSLVGTVQVGNNVLCMPVARVLSAEALQQQTSPPPLAPGSPGARASASPSLRAVAPRALALVCRYLSNGARGASGPAAAFEWGSGRANCAAG